MAAYTVKLTNKQEIAGGTMEFQFEKPEGFTFRAGNSLDWTLINPPETDSHGSMRPFSVASAPYESHLAFATRMRDTAFKRTLKNMQPGSEIQIEGPFGSFLLHNDTSKPAVFLAGGIGITPFYSMIKQATHEKLPHKIFLFYSNHSPADTAYLTQLQELEKQNSNFKLIAVMTRDEIWNGEKGHIDRVMLEKNLGDLSKPIYYMAGPPQMLKAMRDMLISSGISEDNMKWEEFSGY